MLEKELKTYHSNKFRLQSENSSGGFVVINGNEILGVWRDRLDALKAGIEKYGNVPFLVKNIYDDDTKIYFSRNLTFA